MLSVGAADMDVESFAEGILGSIVVNEGERANVGASIAFIAESEADMAEAKKKGGSAGGAAAAPAGACGCGWVCWWAFVAAAQHPLQSQGTVGCS